MQKDISPEELERRAIRDELMRRAGDIVPGATSFLHSGGGVYVASRDQLPDLATEAALVRSTRRDFCREVLWWFVGEGFLPENRATGMMARFEAYLEKLPGQD